MHGVSVMMHFHEILITIAMVLAGMLMFVDRGSFLQIFLGTALSTLLGWYNTQTAILKQRRAPHRERIGGDHD